MPSSSSVDKSLQVTNIKNKFTFTGDACNQSDLHFSHFSFVLLVCLFVTCVIHGHIFLICVTNVQFLSFVLLVCLFVICVTHVHILLFVLLVCIFLSFALLMFSFCHLCYSCSVLSFLSCYPCAYFFPLCNGTELKSTVSL